MARILIAGCGCRGLQLASELLGRGHSVRATTRRAQQLQQIARAGAEACIADPLNLGQLLPLLAEVSVLVWPLASAQGDSTTLDRLHGQLLEHLLERLVDTPVRGFVYETAGSIDGQLLSQGRSIVEHAHLTWKIPIGYVNADSGNYDAWLKQAVAAVAELIE